MKFKAPQLCVQRVFRFSSCRYLGFQTQKLYSQQMVSANQPPPAMP